ncbi:hypothetical protein EON65_48780, partial [archaeon]
MNYLFILCTCTRIQDRPTHSQENKLESDNIILTGSVTHRASTGPTTHPTTRPTSTPTATASSIPSQKPPSPILSKILNARVQRDKQAEEILFSSDDEERESMKAQRLMYKSYLSGQYSSANSSTPTAMLHTDSLSNQEEEGRDGDHTHTHNQTTHPPNPLSLPTTT